jgi:hypothetical protein
MILEVAQFLLCCPCLLLTRVLPPYLTGLVQELTKTIEEYDDFAELVEDQYLKPLKVDFQ